MKLLPVGLCFCLVFSFAQASEYWDFSTKIAVTGLPVTGVFHHLDGAGRRHIAASEKSVAVVWEDNSSGDPQIYASQKIHPQATFTPAQKLSDGNEAYEPAISLFGDSRFLLAWEQDAAVYARVLSLKGFGEKILLGAQAARHVSLASIDKLAYAVWCEQRAGDWFVRVAALSIDDAGKLAIDSISDVEKQGLKTQVLFPSIAVNDAGISVAWEDRRAGHTRILASYSNDAAKTFTAPQNLNEFFSDRNEYDRGNGVTRVSLTAFAEDEILAAWMDKRRGGVGYGIYASLGAEGGAYFGPNEKVHGSDGDKLPHYNPSTAGGASGNFAVAWDDYRRGDSDVWLSTYNADDEWSIDFSPSVASGNGEQSHPSIAYDTAGALHLLWMEREDPNAPSRLWYSYGKSAD